MFARTGFVLLVVAASLALVPVVAAAEAKGKKQQKKEEAPAEDSVHVLVPEKPVQSSPPPEDRRDMTRTSLLIGVTSWMPQSFGFATFPGVTVKAVSRGAVPFVRAGMSFPAFRLGSTDCALYGGVGFVPTKRDAVVEAENRATSQSVGVISGRVAVEVRPKALGWSSGFGHVDLGLNPTLATATRNEVSDSQTLFALPVEISVGASINMRVLWAVFPESALDLMVSQWLGGAPNIKSNATTMGGAIRLLF